MRVAIDARSVLDRMSGIGNTVAALVRHIDRDEALREKLICAGSHRVQQFPWESAAWTMLEVFREAAS